MNSSYFHNSNSNNINSKLLLPPISEIKFSESIKKKLYTKNNNKTSITSISNNANINRFISKSVDHKEIADNLSKKDLTLSENFNGTSTESEEFFSTVNNESSVFIDEDHVAEEEEAEYEGEGKGEGDDEDEGEDNDYEDDYDDDDDDDDEFIYLYRNNDDKYDQEEELFDCEIKNSKNQSETEVLQLRKQLSFLKKENYYMQLEIYRLESKLKKNKEAQLNTIELEKHLSNLENFFISKQNYHMSRYRNTSFFKNRNRNCFESISTRFEPFNQNLRENSIISDILSNNHLKSYRSDRSSENFKFPDIDMSNRSISRSHGISEYSPRKIYNLPKLNGYGEEKKLIDDALYYLKPT